MKRSFLSSHLLIAAVVTPLVAIALPGTASAHGILALRSEEWTVRLEPDRLGVTAERNGRVVSLSDPGPTSEPARNPRSDGKIARWEMPARGVSVTATLHGTTLDVTFQPRGEGHVTFPRLGAAASDTQAFILPMLEGTYVPASDAWWAGYLKEHGPEDTLEGLSMPFVGVDHGDQTATYIFANRFHNRLAFDDAGGRIQLAVTHETEKRPPHRAWTVRIVLGGPSPVEPARVYRRWLIAHGQFVTMREKIRRVPDTAKLLGAPQVYLWGGGAISRHDVRDWKEFCRVLNTGGKDDALFMVRRAWQNLSPEARVAVERIANGDFADRYATGIIAASLSDALGLRDFASPPVANDGTPRAEMEITQRNADALYRAFPRLLEPPDRWGDGVSVKMMDRLSGAGFDRLWLGLDSWGGGLRHPAAIRRAISLGYLIAPYDSYNSIHAPGAANTWETAQFDTHLWETGAVVRADGTKQPGFQKKGYTLSAAAAVPYVKKRVAGIAAAVRFNSWFLDTDAFGQLYDDYSPLHSGTQADDMRARIRRMEWIRDTFHMVIGSEGGSAYAAPALAFAQGITVPSLGWGDADTANRESPYFVGAYYPPDGPAIFMKSVPLKETYRKAIYDPRFRLPLYETVFHDSVVATRHWGSGSLKFSNEVTDGALTDLLYQTPPLYHWNLDTFALQKEWALAFHKAFSPLHRETGLLPLTSFEWLTANRLVQKTRFGDDVEITANFGEKPWGAHGSEIPPRSAEARRVKTGERIMAWSAAKSSATH